MMARKGECLVERCVTINKSPSVYSDGETARAMRARGACTRGGGALGGVEWAERLAPVGFSVKRLCKFDVHSLKGLFAVDRQVGNQEKLLTAFFDVRLHAVMGAPGFLQDDHRDRRLWFAVRTG